MVRASSLPCLLAGSACRSLHLKLCKPSESSSPLARLLFFETLAVFLLPVRSKLSCGKSAPRFASASGPREPVLRAQSTLQSCLFVSSCLPDNVLCGLVSMTLILLFLCVCTLRGKGRPRREQACSDASCMSGTVNRTICRKVSLDNVRRDAWRDEGGWMSCFVRSESRATELVHSALTPSRTGMVLVCRAEESSARLRAASTLQASVLKRRHDGAIRGLSTGLPVAAL